MHHVLFSFDCYYRELINVNLWHSVYQGGLQDQIRDLFVDIVRNHVLPAESVVKQCWRYHVTYMKVIESLIVNQDLKQALGRDGRRPEYQSRHLCPKIKPFSHYVSHLEALQIVQKTAFEVQIDYGLSNNFGKTKRLRFQNQQSTASQVQSYACQILVRQLMQN